MRKKATDAKTPKRQRVTHKSILNPSLAYKIYAKKKSKYCEVFIIYPNSRMSKRKIQTIFVVYGFICKEKTSHIINDAGGLV